MAKVLEPEASQPAESQVTQAETTQTTDQQHHEEKPEETGANDDGQTETSPPAAVTATEVTEDQLPPLAEIRLVTCMTPLNTRYPVLSLHVWRS
ncbi:hypothetical protein V500_02064 [Pseudogymnoascus sp. VKM F-4518 (FW-2643)]|nr:hypothetical protein V500_02064 [Pseudogymnoascus sp. VKM F-4518 (FW-2643)]